MSNQTIEPTAQSRPEWDDLESWARAKVQQFIQDLLEEEVTEKSRSPTFCVGENLSAVTW